MKYFEYIIQDEMGLHARPTGLFVKMVKGYNSVVSISIEDKQANGSKLFEIMGLGAKKGQKMAVEVSGPDEETAAESLLDFLKANL